MISEADAERQAIFAGNRAASRIALAADMKTNGETRRTRVHEAGSLRVRFPRSRQDALEAVIVNTAGGIAGGDRCNLDIAAGAGARLLVGTSAAEKIYRSLGPAAEINLRLVLGAGASLSWLPQETILFDRARLSRRIEIDMAADARLVVAEAVVFGRSAMGETVEDGAFADRWTIRRDGRLIFAEAVRLDRAVARTLAEPAVSNGGAALATILIVPGGDALAARVRALGEGFRGEAGISAWNGIAIARFCAPDGASLRHDIIAVLAELSIPLPRLWLQ